MPSRRHRRQTGPVLLATLTLPSIPGPLGRPATVVRDRGHVLDGLDLDPRRLEGPDGLFAAAAGSFDPDVQRPQPRLLGGGGGGGGRLLRGEGRSLARSLEAERARAGPRHHVAFQVGDRAVGVVEGGMYMRDAVDDVLLLLLGLLARRLLGGRGRGGGRL